MRSGDRSGVENRICDQNVTGLSPGWSDRRIFFSSINSLCWLLFHYPFQPCVTTGVYKISWSFCQRCRGQATAKHTCTLCLWTGMKWHCKLVHGCVVYRECAPRQQQFHMALAMSQTHSAVSTPLWSIFKNKTSYNRHRSLRQNHMLPEHSDTVSVLDSRE